MKHSEFLLPCYVYQQPQYDLKISTDSQINENKSTQHSSKIKKLAVNGEVPNELMHLFFER